MRIEFQFYLIHTLIGNFDKQTNNKRHAYPINLSVGIMCENRFEKYRGYRTSGVI